MREAAAIGDNVRRQLDADPYQLLAWDVEVGASLWKPIDGDVPYTDIARPLSAQDRKQLDQQSMCYALVDGQLAARGLAVEADDRERLTRAVSMEMQRVAQDHQAYLLGKTEVRPLGASSVLRAPSAPLTFQAIIEGWLIEKKPIKKTEYVWRRTMNQLSEFLGHDDVRRIRADDLVAWKADLLAKGLKAKTIRDSKLAPVRAILQWATDNRKLEVNPGARINIDLKARSSEKRRGYTDDEAKIILQAARKEKETHRRWVPWVSAYTGARIAEICQLRSEDIKQIDGIWCIAFAAEAGSLKNVNSERVVPVHSALKDEGFLKFVASARKGPDFLVGYFFTAQATVRLNKKRSVGPI